MTIITHKHGFGISGSARCEHPGSEYSPKRIKGFSDDQPNSSVYSGRIYPSGDFSVGIIPKKKVTDRDKQYEAAYGRITSKAIRWQEGEEAWIEVGTICEPSFPPSPNLVNSAKFSQPSRKSYGQGGITTYGKRMVASAAVILEKEWGKRCTGFGTLTLPPMSAENEKHVCADWANIVRSFFQELCRHQRRHGVDSRYVHVTEIQERRWSETGSLGLHIHFLYKARKHAYSKNWNVCANWCRDAWRRILANSLGMSADEIPKPRCELALIKKSASGYLGKYISKGGKVLEDIKKTEEGKSLLPRSWWGLSNTLRDDVKKQTIRLSSEMSALLWKLVSSGNCQYIAYSRAVEITSDLYGIRIVGRFGRIVPFLIRNVVELLTG